MGRYFCGMKIDDLPAWAYSLPQTSPVQLVDILHKPLVTVASMACLHPSSDLTKNFRDKQLAQREHDSSP
jgi:hypothetical protein